MVDNGVHVVTSNETQVGGTGNKLSGDQVTVPVNLLQANQLVAAPSGHHVIRGLLVEHRHVKHLMIETAGDV